MPSLTLQVSRRHTLKRELRTKENGRRMTDTEDGELAMTDHPQQGPVLSTAQKNALKAFKKRLKLARLDDESRLGGRYTSKGGHSGIQGILPPQQYPASVWEELVALGRLRSSGGGTYELVEQE